MTNGVPRAIRPSPTISRLATAACALALAACSANLGPGIPGSANLASPSSEPGAAGNAPQGQASAPQPRSIDELAKVNAAEPGNTEVAAAYSRALKQAGNRTEALAVLDKATAAQPTDQTLLVQQGLLSLELGHAAKADKALKAAGGDTSKDWRVVSGQGVAASSLGRQREAQRHFARALKLSPDNPTVLNNLAMSLILDRKPDQAEAMLQRAARAGAPRQQVERNIALAKALKEDTLGGGN
jgi:Flp pilus assembly protein TadD